MLVDMLHIKTTAVYVYGNELLYIIYICTCSCLDMKNVHFGPLSNGSEEILFLIGCKITFILQSFQ